MSVLSLEVVSKAFEPDRPLFKDVSLDVLPSQSIAILGPSGSGKSTLLHIMGGLLTPDSGHVRIGGIECRSRSQWDSVRMRTLGHIFQDAWLLPALTAAENIEIPMIGVEHSSRARRERVDRLLELVLMPARRNTRAANLSGGERQRVALARAIANRPRIILADEPTGNLDMRATLVVIELLHDICKSEGTALILATHDLESARSCQRQLRLAEVGLRPIA